MNCLLTEVQVRDPKQLTHKPCGSTLDAIGSIAHSNASFIVGCRVRMFVFLNYGDDFGSLEGSTVPQCFECLT